MIFFQDTTDFMTEGPSAVTIGKFDGLHAGHLKLLSTIREYGHQLIKTLFVISPDQDRMLLTKDEFDEAARLEGMDVVIRCPFTPQVRSMTPCQFVEEVLIGKLNAAFVCVGDDFRFGKDRAASAYDLSALCSRAGIRVQIVPEVSCRGIRISSSAIREAIQKGDMELAAMMLGKHYQIRGKVIHGNHIGTGMGIPTANIAVPEGKLVPPYGVYFTKILSEGETLRGITNIGMKPTVGADQCTIETFLYDTSQDLYEKTIRVELLHFLRPERRFPSLEALKLQAGKDLEAGREYFFEQGFMGREPDSDHSGPDQSGGRRSGVIF